MEKIKKKKNKNIFPKILIFLGVSPFLFVFLMGIIYSITGFNFMFSTSYGFEALWGTIVIYSFLFWPIYIIGALLVIIGIIRIRVIKRKNALNR